MHTCVGLSVLSDTLGFRVVSVIRHSGFYAQSRARTNALDLAETGSDIVEATHLNIAGNH